MSRLLDTDEITRQLQDLPDWKLDGDEIAADFTFADFGEAMVFVNRVAALAEDANHHPDIDIRWNKVRLVLTSHDSGGLTQRDIEMAHRISSGE
ncbi:4a-hydroxytetrahydrobiopterin dehydratase [Microlunatus elymi]|uniref:Putative pterin-4-alpha-carbinolamine dehydratase n=1 Tax=Microlunatus elymi TaxID=2596828 RepID=A0A516PZS9_9ACTN|nr:4a-hydroxytetrahydrobiopterin dehydratase [Microlunatus elymi]QDP96689.1 4a-hydroxytetrahydrobiopterin dehydratase [Microlunatus elymi]